MFYSLSLYTHTHVSKTHPGPTSFVHLLSNAAGREDLGLWNPINLALNPGPAFYTALIGQHEDAEALLQPGAAAWIKGDRPGPRELLRKC